MFMKEVVKMSNQDYDAVIKWIKNDSAKADSILAAGQIISSGQQTNSALRVQTATCMATDQAAGVMAALSCMNGIPPMKLSVSDIRMNLKTNGAIVPGKQ